MARKDYAGSIKIRPASMKHFDEYVSMLQKGYQQAYSSKKLGLRRSYFGEKVFSSKRVRDYLRSNIIHPRQKAWFAFLGKRLVGSITARDEGKRVQLKGFYVATDLKGRGIGRRIMITALKSTKGKGVYFTTYVHNTRTMDMYRKWGFEKFGRLVWYHWEEWPKGVGAYSQRMKMSGKQVAEFIKKN